MGMEFQLLDFRVNDLVKLEIKINQEPVDPLACIVHRDKAYGVGKALAGKLKQLIPKQQFRVPIQAAVGSRVIASESIAALRKDVLAKGKNRMKSLGKVDVPQEAFMAVLKLKTEESD